MMRTGSSFARAIVLLFTVVVLCGLIVTGAIAHAHPAESLKGGESGAWQEHALYLISHQPCAKSTNDGGDLWPQHICDSALADLAVRSGATMRGALLSHVFNHCAKSTNDGGDLWPPHICDSALADLAVRSGATMRGALLSHVFNYSGAGFDF